MVFLNDLIGQTHVARGEGMQRMLDLLLHQPAHLQDAGAQPFQIGVELFRNVFGLSQVSFSVLPREITPRS